MTEGRCLISSGYIPAKDEPDPDEILETLREAVSDNPRLADMPAEEVARQLILEGRVTVTGGNLTNLSAQGTGSTCTPPTSQGRPCNP